MTAGFEERRRTPRIALAQPLEFRLSRRLVVRLVDLSEQGALMASDEHLPVGEIAQLRFALWGQPVKASVQIRREQVGPERSVLLGAAILTADRASHVALGQFLGRPQQ